MHENIANAPSRLTYKKEKHKMMYDWAHILIFNFSLLLSHFVFLVEVLSALWHPPSSSPFSFVPYLVSHSIHLSTHYFYILFTVICSVSLSHYLTTVSPTASLLLSNPHLFRILNGFIPTFLPTYSLLHVHFLLQSNVVHILYNVPCLCTWMTNEEWCS